MSEGTRLKDFVLAVTAVWVIFLVGAGLLSLKATADLPYVIADKRLNALPRPEFVEVGSRTFGFLVLGNKPDFDDLFATGVVLRGPDWTQRLFERSYMAADDRGSGTTRLLGSVASRQYVADLNATAGWISQRAGPLQGQIRIGHVGFANPWPFLTANRYPPGSMHWIHRGTTYAVTRPDDLLRPLEAADIVVVPLLEIDDLEHSVMKCAFYLWNIRNGSPFVPVAITGLNLIFLRSGGLLTPDSAPVVEIDAARIGDHCGAALRKAGSQGR